MNQTPTAQCYLCVMTMTISTRLLYAGEGKMTVYWVAWFSAYSIWIFFKIFLLSFWLFAETPRKKLYYTLIGFKRYLDQLALLSCLSVLFQSKVDMEECSNVWKIFFYLGDCFLDDSVLGSTIKSDKHITNTANPFCMSPFHWQFE